MSKKPVIDVDEDMLRDAMLEVPAMRNSRPVAPARESEPAPADPSPEPEPPKFRRKKREDVVVYREQFLVNDGVRTRVTTAIDREIYGKIRKLLSMAAPETSIVAFISNVLEHPFFTHREEINELYRRETEKPL